MWHFVSACHSVLFLLMVLCFLKCTLIFVVVMGATIGDENEKLRFSDGARFGDWFYLFEVRFWFRPGYEKSTCQAVSFFLVRSSK